MKNIRILSLGILLLGIGFAVVSTTLVLSGNVNISTNNDNFDVIFTKAVIDGTNTSSAIIESGKKITFSTKDLITVGDISKLDFEVTNNSTMYDAKVSVACSTTGTNSSYYKISTSGEMVIAGKRTGTGKVYVKLLKATTDDIREEFTCTLTATAVERTEIGEDPPFSTDSWATIAEKVKSGTYPYEVGDTKEVDLGETLGTHTLRVANTSPCTNGETSQTACGFVLEFADIITTHVMNPNGGTNGTNVGGWQATPIRAYVNNDIYNALPSDLQAVIVDTTVVSSHGSTEGENNFTTTDKLYLLSTKEVYGTSHGNDTVGSETRQLDYYKSKGVTTSNHSGAIKQYNGSNSYWWLRSASSTDSYRFFSVKTDGNWHDSRANNTRGVSPSFRIA